MIDELLKTFANSSQGQATSQAFTQNGLDASDFSSLLEHGLPAAAQSFGAQGGAQGGSDMLGSLLGSLTNGGGGSLLTGALGGLLSGQGMTGALEGAGSAMLLGTLAESLAQKAGIDAAKAKLVATIAAPFIVKFLHEKYAEHQAANPA